MLMTNNRAIMGEQVNSRAWHILGLVTTGAMFTATVGLVMSEIKGSAPYPTATPLSDLLAAIRSAAALTPREVESFRAKMSVWQTPSGLSYLPS
jgi:hypothetical protein